MADMAYAGWVAAAVFDPATGTVVQLKNIIPDACEWTDNPIKSNTTVSSIHGGKERLLRIGFAWCDDREQLADWMRDRTKLMVVVHGQNDSILWYEPRPILFEEGLEPDARSGVKVDMVEIEAVGVMLPIFKGVNPFVLAGYWLDADGDGLAKAFDITPGVYGGDIDSESFAGLVQTFGMSAGTEGNIVYGFPFPVSGSEVEITGAIDINPSASIASGNVLLEFRNYAGSIVSVGTAFSPVGIAGSTWTRMQSAGRPSALAYWVCLSIEATLSGGAPASIQLRRPSFRGDDRATYVGH